MKGSKPGDGNASNNKELNAKHFEKFAAHSSKAKADNKLKETIGIGKPAGKKHQDDRGNIETMKGLLR